MSRRGNTFSNLFSSVSSSSRDLPTQPPPAEFFCPISYLLMANPVVVPPTGFTFDHPCIEACRELNFSPPHLNLNLDPNFPLIPNFNLYNEILRWCHLSGHPLPTLITRESALHFIIGLMSMSTPPPPPTFNPSSYTSIDPVKEKWVLKHLNKPKNSSKESAMDVLLDTHLCSPQILAAIIPILTHPENSNLQIIAANVIYHLSCNPSNQTHILRCSVVPPLITILSTGVLRARAAAARTFYKLSVNVANRLVISALGAIPALLDKFCEHFLSHIGRIDAALDLYHLSLIPANLEVVIENGGVGRLLEAAADNLSPLEERRHALILLYCLTGVERGREEVMKENGGGMRVLLRLMKDEGEVLCLGSMSVMYRVCRLSIFRFRVAAMAVGVEEVLMERMEELGEIGNEMAMGMVSVMRGECVEREKLKEVALEIDEEEDEEREGMQKEKKKKKVKERFREIIRSTKGESSSSGSRN